ncbi:hypothetical protein DL765_007015 [Monosporascus sp. GIB2]|nr:hypothetical protein DL765_007015 [Monosporascus sp. GIB2]
MSASDARFFSISPAEALSMDPMQRMLLEEVYEASENAGIPISSFSGTNAGCYMGCFTHDYDQIAKKARQVLPNTTLSALVNRYCQTESASASTIKAPAWLSIRLALCSRRGMAALVLKPLDEAIRNGDTVRAVIRGPATGLIRSAYEQAGCDPAVTAYCEAHGTGMPAGDSIERGAIGDTLEHNAQMAKGAKLFVGSVKTNIGHIESSSCLAGLIKAVMSLEKAYDCFQYLV